MCSSSNLTGFDETGGYWGKANDRNYIQPRLCGPLQIFTMVSPMVKSQNFVTSEFVCLAMCIAGWA